MAFDVNFWTFSKKERSTAQPTGTGTVYSCTANEPLDLLAPVISLKLALNTSSPPTVYNYARIANFSRYYWVTGWEIRDGLWWASLRVDALASWKSQIGNNNVYVYRSSYSYSLRLTDSAYPQLVAPSRLTVSLPKVWTVGGANESGAARDTFTVVAGIISESGTKYYAFTLTNWQKFFQALFSQDYYNDVLGEFGATEYPEAKVAVNPMQYIASAVIIPLGIGYSLNLRYAIDYSSTVNSIHVGNVSVSSVNPQSPFTAYVLKDIQDEWTYTVTLGSDFWHPQADERGDWLNYAPATEYLFYFPPLGGIPLDADVIDGADSISYTVYPDYKANVALLDIAANFSSPSRSFPLYRGEFQLGTGIQLSNVMTTGSVWKGAESMLQNASPGGLLSDVAHISELLPVVGGITRNAIQSAIHGSIGNLSTKGQFGSVSSMGGSPRLIVTHWLYANDDLDGRGRPLCDKRVLNTIPGFITAEADELSISCTDPELSEIRAAVASGFFYE